MFHPSFTSPTFPSLSPFPPQSRIASHFLSNFPPPSSALITRSPIIPVTPMIMSPFHHIRSPGMTLSPIAPSEQRLSPVSDNKLSELHDLKTHFIEDYRNALNQETSNESNTRIKAEPPFDNMVSHRRKRTIQRSPNSAGCELMKLTLPTLYRGLKCLPKKIRVSEKRETELSLISEVRSPCLSDNERLQW